MRIVSWRRRIRVIAVITIGCAALAAILWVGVGVTAQGDITPPAFVGIHLNPRHVNTAHEDQTIVVTVLISDDLSGFDHGYIRFSPAIGTTQFRDVAFYYPDIISGTLQYGIYTDSLELPQYSAEGRWVVRSIGTYDRVGNQFSLADFDEDGVDEYRQYYFLNDGNAPPTPTSTPIATTPSHYVYLSSVLQEVVNTPAP